MSIGILPNVNFYQTESGCKFGAECSFPHWKVDDLNFCTVLRQLAVLELLSFLPVRACFGFECPGEPFPSSIILLVDQLVLFEIQFIRVVRPVIPIFEHKLVAEAH